MNPNRQVLISRQGPLDVQETVQVHADAAADRPSGFATRPATPVSVFAYVLTHGAATRTELSATLGLSPAGVTRIVRPLLADGMLREVVSTPATARLGRPAQLLEVVTDRWTFVGVKVSQREVVAVRTDLRGTVAQNVTVRLPTRRSGSIPVPVDDVVTTIAAARQRLTGAAAARVGVAISGDVNTTDGRVELSPLLGWRAVDLRPRLEDALALPVVIDNDVRAVTATEQWFGAGMGAETFAVITIGAGIGCGLVVNSRIQRGAFGVAGELGHLCVDIDGPVCHCGARGCVEAIAAAGPLLAAASEAYGHRLGTLARLATVVDKERASAGPRPVARVVRRAGKALSAAIAAVINLVGPQRILISAEGFDIDTFYGTLLRRELQARTFGRASQVDIVTRELPFTEWARGAAVTAAAEFVAQHR